jgi:hypothetical protein
LTISKVSAYLPEVLWDVLSRAHDIMKLDPFGVRHHVANPAIQDQHRLAPDIYESLFDKVFFQSQVYTVWSQGDRPWSLHCYGDPGCGKVRFMLCTQEDMIDIVTDHACCHNGEQTPST